MDDTGWEINIPAPRNEYYQIGVTIVFRRDHSTKAEAYCIKLSREHNLVVSAKAQRSHKGIFSEDRLLSSHYVLRILPDEETKIPMNYFRTCYKANTVDSTCNK